METIVVYSTATSNRLKYALDWLLKERLQLSYRITQDEAEVTRLPFFIAYGRVVPNGLYIPDAGLLWQTGKQEVATAEGEWRGTPTLFATDATADGLPFDILSAIFFLLSRYEEYYSFKPDKHNRYPATCSILYKKGWLQRPLADEWAMLFGKKMQSAGGVVVKASHYSYQPTYDIDMAYSHLYKGAGRIIGAYMRALLKGDVKQITERTQVLKNKQKDPYDSFRWLRQLHKEYDCKPIYFVLSAFRTTPFDKNIPPEHPAMMRVIKNLAKEGTIGIHPSYYSEEEGLLAEEKKLLENISSRVTHISRQHYIRIRTPHTWRTLLLHGITEDYSMGYGAQLGFRAGTGSSFLWFDLENDAITVLRIHPFCFMDTAAHYEGKMTADQAFARLEEMSKRLEQTGSTLITVFHNFSLGTSHEWKGWRQAYEHFLQDKLSRVNLQPDTLTSF